MELAKAANMAAPELRALYVQVCHVYALNLEGVQGLAADSQPPRSAALELQLWETGVCNDVLSLQTTCSSAA